MIFVVLGMHKSGTTLVSQILHHSGINMGDFDDGTSYDKGNKYERQKCLKLDLSILGASDDEVLHLTKEARSSLSPEQRQEMRKIIDACESAYPDWGFKDPRCCLTYPMWAEELPDHKIIVVYRSPEQIWPRFKWQGKRKYHTNFHRAYAFLKRWHEHNQAIVNVLEEASREAFVVNYQDFMNSNEGHEALAYFVGRDLPDRRSPELYRSRRTGDIFLAVADRVLSRQYGWSIDATMASLAKWDHCRPDGSTS